MDQLEIRVEFQCLGTGLVIVCHLRIVGIVRRATELTDQHFAPPLVILAGHVQCRACCGDVAGCIVLGDLFGRGNKFIYRLRRLVWIKACFGKELLVVE
ncbi:hypothetical protein D3C86_1813530 [compost metagenome]